MPEEVNWNQMTGIAGVHYVAYLLSYWGYAAVLTSRNIKGPDLLVSNADGSSLVAIQVKTAATAVRMRGRGAARAPDHYEWDIGWASARIRSPNTYVALVDFRDTIDEEPQVFLVPSVVVYDYFKKGDPKTWPRARYHPPAGQMAQYIVTRELLAHTLWRIR